MGSRIRKRKIGNITYTQNMNTGEMRTTLTNTTLDGLTVSRSISSKGDHRTTKTVTYNGGTQRTQSSYNPNPKARRSSGKTRRGVSSLVELENANWILLFGFGVPLAFIVLFVMLLG